MAHAMAHEVRLAEVTAENWWKVASLRLADDQKHLVASNLYSIAQSKFDPDACPRAIYAGDAIIGFLMYDLPDADDDPKVVSIYRFMIDKDHQGKGYGRAALACAIAEIREIPGIDKVSISYLPDNAIARTLYASFGFIETGRIEYGEAHAELTL
ncbi:MAG: Spermine/spermidine acetyltransferase [Pseudorhodoplanes sp.]|nr:Spermine/spermidine acetyltransferase [Pseudorhodoplanes sp.]